MYQPIGYIDEYMPKNYTKNYTLIIAIILILIALIISGYFIYKSYKKQKEHNN